MSPQNSYIDEAGATLDYAPPSEDHPPTFAFSLIEVLTQLARRKHLIAKGAAVGMLIGVLLSLVLPVRYTAVTTLMPPQQTPSTATVLMNQLTTGGGASPLAALAGGSMGLKNPNDIYIGLLNSRPIADAIIRQFGLATLYRAKDMTAARQKLANNTVVASEKNGFLTVSVTDKDKQQAAAMANAYTEELRVLTKTLAVTEASQRRLFYEEQLKQAKESLIDAEVAFQQVQQSKGLVQLDAQAKAMIEGLALLRAQVAAKEVEVQALRSYSTEHNPNLELAERELSSLRGEAAQLEQRNHSSGFTGLGLGDVPGAGMEYLRAEHEVKYRQTMFDLLIKQYDAARLDEAKDAAIIQVVEAAIAPDRKSSPKRVLIVVCFTVAGVLAGCLLVPLLCWKQYAQSDPRTASQLSGLRRAVTGKT
jgi:capsule polysaccharide export protein KpsE/RkpR